jgi:hypothetical protein
MPCPCRIKETQAPMTEEWGPVMWRALHALAEKSGAITDKVNQIEELNIWPRLIKVMTQGLPCDECRGHYVEWLTANPFNMPANYKEVCEYIRNWLFNLHNNINKKNNKQVFEYTQLSEIYSIVPLKLTLDMLQGIVNRSIKSGAVKLLSWSSTLKYMRSLQFIYN